jgi:DNA-binding transcriptional LysR family regulator
LKELTPFHSCWILNDFFLLVQVVDRGGFTAAGRTLRMPKSTLSHRIQQLEANLGVRLLNHTSRRFGVTDAGQEFYRHAVAMLREAEQAETAIRHRLSEPTGIVRCTAGVATMQFAMRGIMANFLVRYPKVNVVAHATDQYVDIVGENSDVAVRAHSDPLPDSTLMQRTLAPAALVPLRRLGLPRCRRSAANAARSSETPFAVHDARGGSPRLAPSSFEQSEE